MVYICAVLLAQEIDRTDNETERNGFLKRSAKTLSDNSMAQILKNNRVVNPGLRGGVGVEGEEQRHAVCCYERTIEDTRYG